MRIISGKYKGRKLCPPTDDSVRPTTDRIKETVFNILQWDVEGAKVLDLFCGSGALGIECLSRGAAEVVFVDNSRASLELTKCNLKGMEGNYRVVSGDFLGVLRSGAGKFDIIFVDAPYMSGLGAAAVFAAFDCGRVAEGGVVVYEHSAEMPFVHARGDIVSREKKMGSVTVDFVRRKRVALVTGSFDPVTKGHEAVIDEAARMFDEVAVACLENPDKEYFFTPEERLAILNAAVADKKNVRAFYSSGTAVDAAREAGAEALVRGLRGKEDEEYENAMADYNRERGFETVFVTPDAYSDVSSTAARALIEKGDFHLLPSCAIMTAEEIVRRKGDMKQRG